MTIIGDTFSFLFVRHPFVRLASTYQDKVLDNSEANYKDWVKGIPKQGYFCFLLFSIGFLLLCSVYEKSLQIFYIFRDLDVCIVIEYQSSYIRAFFEDHNLTIRQKIGSISGMNH